VIRLIAGLLGGVAIGVMAALYVTAGRAAGPEIGILQPSGLVGRSARFEATVETRGGELLAVDASIEQDGVALPLFSLTRQDEGEVTQNSADHVTIRRLFDRQSHPGLKAGPARVVVSATRPVLFGLREATSSVTVEVEVRLDPPRLTPLSRLHYINHGGSEMVVYRVTPADAVSGVRVGDRDFPGYPAAAAGVEGVEDDGGLRVAFFALLHDQDLGTPIELYALDTAGNEGRADFDHRVFPKTFRRSRIAITDAFLKRVVPRIAERAPELADEELDGSIADLRDLYLFINRELRRQNTDTIAALSAGTVPTRLWDSPFRQLTNSQVESGFADHRTYMYDGDEIDQQVHLGFDLASTANAPVHAANAGTVVHADYLGIFGNCVIVDHGLGLQSLYAHLSSIDVSVGDTVELDHRLGLSGQTGLAGGDHLHYTMLLHGHAVTPVEWWDPNWIEDRITRKLREAAGTP
jgi:murein DD-endopeptidase MepM/ murein hydrolase activator NlpD